MMALGKAGRLLRGSVFLRAVSGILTGASQRGGLSASRSSKSSLQTGKAPSLPALLGSIGTSCAVQANKTHSRELASVGSSAQETGHLFWRSFSQSVQGIQSPKDGDEEGGSSMTQGAFFYQCMFIMQAWCFLRMCASAISPTLPECFRRDRRHMDYCHDEKILVDLPRLVLLS
jgi:hypothetical protein